jgi:hypothetical protein
VGEIEPKPTSYWGCRYLRLTERGGERWRERSNLDQTKAAQVPRNSWFWCRKEERKRNIGPSESTGIAYERVGAAAKNVLLFAFQTNTKNQWVCKCCLSLFFSVFLFSWESSKNRELIDARKEEREC